MSDSLRRRTGLALVAVASLLLGATALCGYFRWEIVDSDAFSRRATSALDDRRVREALAERIVDALSGSAAPNLLVLRPVAVAGVAAIADAPVFRRTFDRAVRARHRALLEGRQRFVLELIPPDTLRGDLARLVATKASAALGGDVRLPVVALEPRTFELRVARGLDEVAAWFWPLLVVTLVVAGACAALAASWRDALARLGVAVAGAGLLVAALVAGLGAYVEQHAASRIGLSDELERDALGALWSALFGDLRTAGLLAAAGGVAVAALAAGVLAVRRLTATAAWARRAARAPGPWAQRGRAVAAVALGFALVLEPALALRVAAVAAGGALALGGIVALSSRTPPAGARVTGAAPAARSASPLLLGATVGAVVAATVAAVAWVLPPPAPAPTVTPPPAGACNGARALCDRRLDEVAFAATHNSYAAAAEPGWFFPNQRHGIARQLRDGIRALLIDLHTGVRNPQTGLVRTDLKAEGSSRNKVVRELSPEALRTADRLAGSRVGTADLDGPRRPYLCHTLCELGAEPMGEQLEIVSRFLADNPREVVLVFVEPYVGVGEIERGLQDAGLLEQAAPLRRDQPLPTLGELIAAGTRLVVLTEQDGGSRPWYLDGFSFVQDTPYQAARPSEFSCRRFRGEPDSPLLLINHWIATFPPAPSRNERVGGRFLERRLRQCERRRGQLPNLVAVDFYERSGMLAAVEQLNAR